MTQYWRVVDEQRDRAMASAVPNLDAALRLEGERVSGVDGSSCLVDVLAFGGQRYFFKRYHEANSGPQQFMLRSRVRAEWDNLYLFRRLGIATPEPIAIGERRCRGIFRQGVLVSAEIPQAIDLAQLAGTRADLFQDRVWFGELCHKLAAPLRRLHDIGFAHNDLNWRNVLLTLEPQLKVYFFDCPNGRRWVWPFRQFRIAKDLAHLDKMGRRYLSRSQRMRFYLAYAGHRRLGAADKRLLRLVLGRDVDVKYAPRREAGSSEEKP